MRLQAQALRLQRDRPAARERVEHRRRFAVAARDDLGAGLGQDIGVVAVLPGNQPLDDPEEALALDGLILLGAELVWVRRRVVHQRGEQHRPAGRQRAPCPPEVQRRRVPVTDRLLLGRRRVDGVQWQRHLDELPPRLSHALSLPHRGQKRGVSASSL